MGMKKPQASSAKPNLKIPHADPGKMPGTRCIKTRFWNLAYKELIP